MIWRIIGALVAGRAPEEAERLQDRIWASCHSALVISDRSSSLRTTRASDHGSQVDTRKVSAPLHWSLQYDRLASRPWQLRWHLRLRTEADGEASNRTLSRSDRTLTDPRDPSGAPLNSAARKGIRVRAPAPAPSARRVRSRSAAKAILPLPGRPHSCDHELRDQNGDSEREQLGWLRVVHVQGEIRVTGRHRCGPCDSTGTCGRTRGRQGGRVRKCGDGFAHVVPAEVDVSIGSATPSVVFDRLRGCPQIDLTICGQMFAVPRQ